MQHTAAQVFFGLHEGLCEAVGKDVADPVQFPFGCIRQPEIEGFELTEFFNQVREQAKGQFLALPRGELRLEPGFGKSRFGNFCKQNKGIHQRTSL